MKRDFFIGLLALATFAAGVDGLTLRDTQVIWTTPKDGIYGEALDEARIQNLVFDHDFFGSAAAGN